MPTNLQRFIQYVADHPALQPSFQLVARAKPASVPPTFSITLPPGVAVAFPDFLVFLTTVTDKPGAKIAWNFAVQSLTAEIKTRLTLARWATHPATILVDVAKALGPHAPKEDKLDEALASPNSFFIPFDRIRNVEPGRQLTQGAYIKVATLDGDYIIHQDATRESVWSVTKTVYLGAKWEPQFTAFLQAAATRNAAAPTRADSADSADSALSAPSAPPTRADSVPSAPSAVPRPARPAK
jgi:hypothetical protein